MAPLQQAPLCSERIVSHIAALQSIARATAQAASARAHAPRNAPTESAVRREQHASTADAQPEQPIVHRHPVQMACVSSAQRAQHSAHSPRVVSAAATAASDRPIA